MSNSRFVNRTVIINDKDFPLAVRMLHIWINNSKNYDSCKAVVVKCIKQSNFLNLGTDSYEDILHESLNKIFQAGIKSISFDINGDVLGQKIKNLISFSVKSIMIDRFRSYKRKDNNESLTFPYSWEGLHDNTPRNEISGCYHQQVLKDLYSRDDSTSSFEDSFILSQVIKNVISKNTLARKYFIGHYLLGYSKKDVIKKLKLDNDPRIAFKIDKFIAEGVSKEYGNERL